MRNMIDRLLIAVLMGIVCGCGASDTSPDSASPVDHASDQGSENDTVDVPEMPDGGEEDAQPDGFTDVFVDGGLERVVCGFPNMACFRGVICASERVDPICADGAWTCPTGTFATESCPPGDAGSDDIRAAEAG